MGHEKFKRTAGFTLIELIVAIAVAAILLTIAVPSLSNLIRNNEVTGQTNELVALINFARSEAIRRNKSIDVDLISGTDGWSAEVRSPDSTEDSEECTVGVLRCASYNDVLLSGASSLTFNSRGYLEPFGPISLVLKHTNCSGDRQRREIDIMPTGQLSSSAASCSGK
ncbi:GspH/FimT family pseudopilin [Wenzhouxiangella sp. 15190]|nr:GspH/FimT family pseudopilin [Wenzhouxiangella sp. 15190]RFF27321.1 prepilin-type N-terminal cleavage/methylation domain-containing protein [Wenzhouxiangella sp. 15181]RFP68754.1 prepilin-type N-terminal cleavage/methylation domain-containing protein [Wenzhouxiangella sp. 15190]